VALFLLASAAGADAQFTFVTNNGTITITKYTGPGGEVIIPDATNGLPVASIGYAAFAYCTNLTRVTIPNGVVDIGSYAFYSCSNLTSVSIPDSVISIEVCAFGCCYGVTDVTIGNSVTNLGDEAFYYCTGLTSVTIPNSVASIGEQAFLSCTSLTNIMIGNSVANIGFAAFHYCTSLRAITVNALNSFFSSVDGVLFNKGTNTLIQCPVAKTGSWSIPDSVTSLGRDAFFYCTNLTTVTIPDSVTSIGPGAFYFCTRLSSITIPDGVTDIGSWTFWNCTSLMSITIPDSVASIGDSTFTQCASLTSARIGNSVTNIGYIAFAGCTSLASVTLPNSVVSIVNGAFKGCTSLTRVTIPHGVASIGDEAFYYCYGLTNVTIGNGVTNIGSYAFYYCIPLHGVYFLGNAPGVGSNVFTGDYHATIYYLSGTTGWSSKFASRPTAVFVLKDQLLVQTTGKGRLSPNYSNAMLKIGQLYAMKATAAAGYLFANWIVSTNWVGGVTTNNATVRFVMQSNLTLCANFVTNPFIGLKGTYYGLFAETNEVRNHDRSGSFKFALAEAGTYSANFQLGAKKLSATGKFDWLGRSWLTLKPTPASNVTVALQLDVTNYSASVEGVAENQFWWAPLFGYRAPAYLGTNLSPHMGKYTVVIPGSDDPMASPGGDSYGRVTVSKAGLLALSGKLADGTALSQSIPVSHGGLWALYASLHSGKGSVQGWMTFTNEDGSDINGILSWIKPAMPTSRYYPLGFTSKHEAIGSCYVVPGKTNPVLNLTNGVVAFSGGNLTQAITNNVLLTTNNKVTNLSSNKLTMTLTLSTGLYSGSVIDTNTGKAILFNGVMLQDLNAGYGYFLGTNRSGQVFFNAPP